ncbi:MAG TPA: aminopeptidase, partial [Longimicrobiales bacterium]
MWPKLQSLSAPGRRLAVLLALVLAADLAGCSPVYVLRAGLAEAKILSRRRLISDVIADPRTSAKTRHKLQLVLDVRTYAARVVGLRTGESYTTYSWVESDTLLLVLQAAPKLAFREYTWWFPIVGRVPYKGYFDFAKARADARDLEKQGYDTYVRPSSAFSTLGWFNDPLLNTIAHYDDVDLGNTVIHELTHNTLYVPSQISFNESLANFVGGHGAIDYFCTVEGDAAPECDLARRRWQDDLVYGAFLTDLVNRLKAVYARTDLPQATRLAMRDSVFQDARARWTATIEPTLVSDQYHGWGRRAKLNNAALIARRIYYDRLEVFEGAYARTGGNLKTFVQEVRKAV